MITKAKLVNKLKAEQLRLRIELDKITAEHDSTPLNLWHIDHFMRSKAREKKVLNQLIPINDKITLLAKEYID